MTRIPSFLDTRSEAAGSVGVASATIPIETLGHVPASSNVGLGIAVAGAASAEVLAAMGERRIIAQRARTLTEFESNALLAVEQARVEADKVDPSAAEQTFRENEMLAQLSDQMKAIRDVNTRVQAESIFSETTTRGMIAVQRGAAVREGEQGRAAAMRMADQLSVQTRSGETDAAVAAGQMAQSVERHIGTAFDDETAEVFMGAARQRFYREQADLILNGTAANPPRPDLMPAFLERPDVVESLSAGERDTLGRAAKRAVEERNSELIIGAFSTARQTIDTFLASPGANSQDFIDIVGKTAVSIAEMPSVKEMRRDGADLLTADDVRLALLSSPLEAAARAGDVDRFMVVASALPGATSGPDGTVTGSTNSEASIIYDMQLDNLRSAVNAVDRRALTEANVQDAITNRWRLENNQQNQAVVDQDAVERIGAFAAANPNAKTDEIGRMAIDTYGPTTLLPSQITKVPTAIAQDPESYKAEDVQQALDLMTYTRSAFPRAYEVSYDSDIRAFHKTYLQMQLPGADPIALAKAAHDALNPENVAQAEQINATAGPLATYALSQFSTFAGEDPLFGIELESDIAVERLFSMEGEIPRLRMDAFADLVPADMVQKYLDFFFLGMKRGQTKEAASADAWEKMSDAGYGATRVFQEDPVIRAMTPERMYGSESYDWRAMEVDLANVIGLDQTDGKIIWPGVIEQTGEFPFPQPIRPVSIAEIGVGAQAPAPTQFPTTEQMALGDGTTVRTSSADYIDTIIPYARERLSLVPAGSELGGNVLEVAPGQFKPLYAVNYRDKHGRLHPLFHQQVNPGTGETEIVPYMVAPIEGTGITHLRDMKRRNLNVGKEREKIRRGTNRLPMRGTVQTPQP